MYYAIAIISGLCWGAIVALSKYFFIWRPYAAGRADNIYSRMALSSGVNVLALLLVFLIRGSWPFSFYATIIATALSLSMIGKFLSRNIVNREG